MTWGSDVSAMTDDELDAYADVIASDDYDPGVVEVDDLRDLRAVAGCRGRGPQRGRPAGAGGRVGSSART